MDYGYVYIHFPDDIKARVDKHNNWTTKNKAEPTSQMLFSCKQLMEQKIYKIIFATLVTFVQILVSEMIFRLVFGSSTFWGTSGAAGADAILFFIELYMGILFLFTNLSILFDNRVLNGILVFVLCGLFVPASLGVLMLLGFIPGYTFGTFLVYKSYKAMKKKWL